MSERSERRNSVIVRVPASTANLGPAFDALGMALTLYAEVGIAESSDLPERAHVVNETHPADIAFRRGGGQGSIWVRSSIPMGRGLGYSGAMRVGGLVAAWGQQAGAGVNDPADLAAARSALLGPAVELEGHGDNVAASLFGGVVATAAGRAVPVSCPLEPSVVMWIPPFATATEKSRTALPSKVSFSDAVFNVGHTALLVAALAAGDVEALRWATADRLHQDLRMAVSPLCHAALAAGLDGGAWCGWLSGSGPGVALLCAPGESAAVAAGLPTDGEVKVLAIDRTGATLM